MITYLCKLRSFDSDRYTGPNNPYCLPKESLQMQ